MNNKIRISIYLMPGMAASPKIFELIKFPSNYKIIYLTWIKPNLNETLKSYAKRMSILINDVNPVLIGVSFGGILVQEISKHIKVKKLIIISSVKSKVELSLSMKFAKKTGIHHLLPLNWIDDLEKLLLFVFGPSIKARVDTYKKYLSERDPDYLKWSINQIVNWKQIKYDKNIFHIHGEKDKVFPLNYLERNKNFITIKNGTHATILRDSTWFSKNLPLIINKD
ncbi:MAG: alpha/beta hydrolase [Flavobacteriaceae bacterium]|mgnify:FL=1